MPNRKLKTPEETEAIVTGEEFKAVPPMKKRQLASHLASAENELAATFPALLNLAAGDGERRFLQALVSIEQGDPAPPTAEPSKKTQSADGPLPAEDASADPQPANG